MSESSAVELFLNVLIYIGRASYQREHPKSHEEGLVLVLIDKMEKVLGVAGWCLASGRISDEEYASIVQKLFSERFTDISDLVVCISDTATTCKVQEDVTRQDELVYLKCENLYEIISCPIAVVYEVSSP